ncbi:TetR/AcrR family transcriptional regulator [Cohnella hashimotonis]|uniref:TetR/AcrR family transcriptional regulator n=1 Tax=Cohnella hashimotonis TaxID=2826895 RepID=A0ABT6TSF7_9BACL|nr:TetR/AcrR family transcriptional regulator [Cohnella hashimotonis]MDI4649791.1 TetR/AcrR family transcriptional regulator [Cohnella hashimotonis]
MKQEERRQQTTQRLLEATKFLIAEKGCQAITMQDIVSRSGLSKGAIFHYVKNKNEIFVWVLQERLEETNASFMNEVEQGRRTFDEPMRRIGDSIVAYDNPQDITNKVLVYLLGKEDDPTVAEALRQYYERSVQLSKTWIETGQRYGVIPATVDADKTGDLFTLMTLGLRIRSSIPRAQAIYRAEDLTAFIRDMLTRG